MGDSNGDVDVRWGETNESTNEKKIFYSSFFSEGQEYNLYDNVEVYDESKTEPHVGKIMKLWEERENGKKRVLIRWFLRPKELGLDYSDDSKELFLAFGKGKGVMNENDVDVVCGKCKVLCTSEDPRNLQPSENELKTADYFFSCIYNVDRRQLSAVQGVVDKLGCDVVFNKQEWVRDGIKVEVNLSKLANKTKQICGKEIGREGTSGRPSDMVKASTKLETESADSVAKLPPESKKRQRDLEVVPEARKKWLIQQMESESVPGALQRSNVNVNEINKSKQLKVLENAKSTAPKEVSATSGVKPVIILDSSVKDVKKEEESKDQSLEKVLIAGDPGLTKIQASKSDKPVTPREASTKPGNSVLLSGGFPKPADAKKPSPSKETATKSPAISHLVKSSPKGDKAMDALAHYGDVESPIDIDKSNKMDEVTGDIRNVDGNDGRASVKLPEVVSKGETKIESRKAGDVSKPVQNYVKEEGSSERRRLVKASESPKALHTSNVKKGEEERSLTKDTTSLKIDKGKDSSRSITGLGLMSDKKEDLNKEARMNASNKKHKGAVIEEKRKIFKELSWEEHLNQGLPSGRVILVQNFDILVTSADVRDMMKSVFEGVSDARLMPQDTICPYGQALVVFESKNLAETALKEMESKCLIVTNSKRPLIASKAKPSESSQLSRFPGHLALEKFKLSRALQNDDYRRAVATSHCSQPNTIEYEMAMEWAHLQEIAQTCKNELFKKQRDEIEEINKSSTKKT